MKQTIAFFFLFLMLLSIPAAALRTHGAAALLPGSFGSDRNHSGAPCRSASAEILLSRQKEIGCAN